MNSPIIFILRILGFIALISPVIARFDVCPPDRDFFLGDTRETIQPRNGERYYIQNEGATRYQATLIAAGLEECLYRLDRKMGEDVKTWRQPVTQTLLVYRGDRMFVPGEIRHLRVWPYETFLREGSNGRTERFKYLISPKRNPWPYGEIEETLENTVQWEQWMNAPLEGIPTIFLDQPTEQQFSLCMENMQWLYKLVTSVVTELLFHAEQFPSKQYDYNQITFTNWWELIRIGETARGTGGVPEPGLDSKYPIFDNAEYEGVCFSRRRNPDYQLPEGIARVEREAGDWFD